MWRTVRVRDQDYGFMVQHDVRKRKFLVHMCAFETLWNSEVNEDEIVNQMKNLNVMLEIIDEDDLMTDINNLFDTTRTDVSWLIERCENELKLNLSSIDAGNVEYSFKCTLHPSDGTTTFRMFMSPAIITIKVMSELLKRKDAELQEYKMSGAIMKRKSIETPVFDEDSFTLPPQLLNAVFSNTKDVFDKSFISCLNQVNPLIRKKFHEGIDLEDSQNVQQRGKVDEKKLTGSSNVSISAENVIKSNKKPAEKIQSIAFHKLNSVNTHKSRPIKKLKGL